MRETKMLTEKFIFVIIFFLSGLCRRMIHGSKRTCFCFSQTVICYLLFVTLENEKIVFGNCQLSTVTLGVDDIVLSL